MLKQWIGGAGSSYHNLVWRLVTDTNAQAVFRRDPTYLGILGVSEYHGREYFAQLDDKTILDLFFASEAADLVGGALTYDFQGHQLSPNTARYAKVLQDLVRLFPAFPAFRSIVEIGVGFGGQARLVSAYIKERSALLQSYDLIDILPVCFLAQSYLDHFNMGFACRYLTKSQIPFGNEWDLVISNYAFSEFDEDLEREYLHKVLLKARCGYLTMNSGLSNSGQWQDIGQSCISVEELLKELPNAVLLQEKPVVFHSNYVIVFGDHAAGCGETLDDLRSKERRLMAEHHRWQEMVARERTDAESAAPATMEVFETKPEGPRSTSALSSIISAAVRRFRDRS